MKIIVKVGGELLEESRRSELEAIACDAKVLIDAGHRVVVVHGGGPQTTALMRALGVEPRIVGGRRVTDAKALEAIEMVVGGKLNIELCGAFLAFGVDAVGLHGVSGRVIACTRRPPRIVAGGGDLPIDFGYVGDVTGVNRKLIGMLIDGGYTPVLACIGSDESGRPYNINADVVASDVAIAIGADRLLLVTGVSGVLENVEDPKTRIPRMTIALAREAMKSGGIKGGMIPKLEEAFRALRGGVEAIHILGALSRGDLVRAVETPGSVGTQLVA